MSNALALFSSNVPAHIAAAMNQPSALATIDLPKPGGFPRISIKNSRFTIVRGKEETVLKDIELNAIIVGVASANHRSLYAGAYDAKAEGVSPICWSSDDKVPSELSEQKQCDTCALCPKNQYGSSTTPGSEAKACRTHRRLVLVAAGDEAGDQFILDVPATSIAGFGKYARDLKSFKAELDLVTTKISFDPSAVGKLSFEPAGWLSPEQMEVIRPRVMDGDVKEALVVQFDSARKKPEVQEQVPVPPAAPGRKKAAPAGFGAAAAPAPAPTPAAPTTSGGFGKAEAAKPAPAPMPPAATESDSNLSALEADLDALIGGDATV